MQDSFIPESNRTWWFRSRAFRIGAVVLAVVAVVLVVLFSRQIGGLLELWGLKAAPEGRTITIDGTVEGTDPYHAHFWHGGYEVYPTDSFVVDPESGRLMLNPLSGTGQ
ncbi:hypothetical protein A2V68_02450 [candidate division Kazan bacterium RBG_13_50_9]|uniref:Uncharacterized protein n=1 Tax=candidate division Kazan bacterium RBG_13_50_9 TaxID=1798535 RepID=A0A1F4NS37_UNCK3|nr:MAG: hypothetical protein A2V68_02450 [candidate division Kazan bacterium RBG_13_50_9]